MRTPSNALPISPPVDSVALGQMRGRVGRQRVAWHFGLQRSSLTVERGPPSLFLFRRWIEARDAAAFRARFFVDDRVDQGRLARADRFFHCAADRKSTRLNSSHVKISYAVFCLK